MAESGIRRRQPRTPEMGCRLPGVGSQSPEPGSQFPKNKMEIPDSGGQMQVPGAQHETMLGEVENPTIGPNDQKKFGSPNDAPSPQKTFDFESFYLPPGADISKYRRFFGTRRRTSAETESRPAAQTLRTVRTLSGLRSWTSTYSLKSIPCCTSRAVWHGLLDARTGRR